MKLEKGLKDLLVMEMKLLMYLYFWCDEQKTLSPKIR